MKARYAATLVIDYDEELEPIEIRAGITAALEGETIVRANGRSAVIDEVRDLRLQDA